VADYCNGKREMGRIRNLAGHEMSTQSEESRGRKAGNETGGREIYHRKWRVYLVPGGGKQGKQFNPR